MILEISKQLSFFNINIAHMCKVMYTNLINSRRNSYVSRESFIFPSIIMGHGHAWGLNCRPVVKGVIKVDYPSCDARHFRLTEIITSLAFSQTAIPAADWWMCLSHRFGGPLVYQLVVRGDPRVSLHLQLLPYYIHMYVYIRYVPRQTKMEECQ